MVLKGMKKKVDHNNSNSERNYLIGIFIELYSIDWNWIYKTNLIVLIRLVIKLTWVFFLISSMSLDPKILWYTWVITGILH
jgi:hypothetical protein